MPQNNNYKPNNNKRYNNKPNYRRYNNNTKTEPQKKKGILSFLFSVEGKVSKEIFTSMFLLLMALMSILVIVNPDSTFEPNKFIFAGYILIYWVIVAISYKRAHSLGISGVYSFMGSILFTPFFAFYKPERDFANDGIYKRKFSLMKKVGTFFGKSNLTKSLYILILCAFYMLPQLFAEKVDYNTLTFLSVIVGLNLIQLFIRKPYRIYTNVVKVLSFLSLIILITLLSMAYTFISIMALMRGPMMMPM